MATYQLHIDTSNHPQTTSKWKSSEPAPQKAPQADTSGHRVAHSHDSFETYECMADPLFFRSDRSGNRAPTEIYSPPEPCQTCHRDFF